jgi:hypothetical protein
LRLTSAGVRVRQASSVLDPGRVEAVVARLSAEERAEALRGLSLLARAAQEHMDQYAESRAPAREGKRRS